MRTFLLLFLAATTTHAQHWCAAKLDVPDGPAPVVQYQLVEQPAATETVVIGVVFMHTDNLTALQVRRRTVEWLKTANQLMNEGTSRYRIVLKRAGVRLAPENVSRVARETPGSDRLTYSLLALKGRSWHSLRREVGGDIVTLVIPTRPNDHWAGFADIASKDHNYFDAVTFNVVSMRRDRRNVQREGEVFMHEVGHNLGLHHDRETLMENGENPRVVSEWLPDPLGLGYVATTFSNGAPARSRIGTIMAYSDYRMRGFSRPVGTLGIIGLRQRAKRGDETTNGDRALRTTAATVAALYSVEPNDPDPPPLPEPEPEPEPEPDPAPDPNPGPPSSRDCPEGYCHTTAAGHAFAVQYFHEGAWKWAAAEVQSGDSAVFHFFGPDNLEVFAKVLDACGVDRSFWVYASGLTDLPIALHVWRDGAGQSVTFPVPDGMVLRPQNGGVLRWC